MKIPSGATCSVEAVLLETYSSLLLYVPRHMKNQKACDGFMYSFTLQIFIESLLYAEMGLVVRMQW